MKKVILPKIRKYEGRLHGVSFDKSAGSIDEVATTSHRHPTSWSQTVSLSSENGALNWWVSLEAGMIEGTVNVPTNCSNIPSI